MKSIRLGAILYPLSLRPVAITTSLLLLCMGDFVSAQNEVKMPIRLKGNACSEYALGGVTLQYFYRVGDSKALRKITIRKKKYFPGSNSFYLEAMLPTTYGTTPLHIASYCKSKYGRSLPSNEVTVTSCDYFRGLDSDNDGLNDAVEDTNCDGFFSPGDYSNLHNPDTDGDGVGDQQESKRGYSPTSVASSLRPFILAGCPFDPDKNGTSNPIAWRPSNATFYIADYPSIGKETAIAFGTTGDIPFTYLPKGKTADVGVIRLENNEYLWFFHGVGFGGTPDEITTRADARPLTSLRFGGFGDNIALGPWERPDMTNPAVLRLYDNKWTLLVLLENGKTRVVHFGVNGDIPIVQDYNGDGILELAVFRPSEGKTYVRLSSNKIIKTYALGDKNSVARLTGDIDGDGRGDVMVLHPKKAFFQGFVSSTLFPDETSYTITSENSFKMQLGKYGKTYPLNWQIKNGKTLLTVIEHATGKRSFHPDNNPLAPVEHRQWGMSGDIQG